MAWLLVLHGEKLQLQSTDAGLGPLMRDIKNKICRDTEMIALMEDDNGMEVSVNNLKVALLITTNTGRRNNLLTLFESS